MAARFETLAEFILSLPTGSLLSDAAILRIPEEGPRGPVSKGGRLHDRVIDRDTAKPARTHRARFG
jgi:hypothetical protein